MTVLWITRFKHPSSNPVSTDRLNFSCSFHRPLQHLLFRLRTNGGRLFTIVLFSATFLNVLPSGHLWF